MSYTWDETESQREAYNAYMARLYAKPPDYPLGLRPMREQRYDRDENLMTDYDPCRPAGGRERVEGER